MIGDAWLKHARCGASKSAGSMPDDKHLNRNNVFSGGNSAYMLSHIKMQWWALRSEVERSESTGHRYAGLDLLRGIAALVVVLKHFKTRLDLPYLAPNGYLAVDFFFVLSGFVIASAYQGQLKDGTLSATAFFRKRLIRLLPLVVIGAIVAVALELGRLNLDQMQHLKDVAIAFVFGITLLPILQTSGLHTPTLEQSVFPLNTPTWSLFFEIFANIAFAVCARFRLFSWTLLVVIFASGVWLLFAIKSAGSANFGFNPAGFWLGFPRVIWSFSVGLLIYKYRFLAPKGTFVPASVVLIAVLMLPDTGLPKALTDTIAVMIIMPVVVFACLNADLGKTARRWAVWGGNLSYPLYALHYPLVHVLSFAAKGLHLSWAQQGGVVIAGTVVITGFSAVIYAVVDVPARRRLSLLARRA
ncbi:acyltransferase [Rhizobium sp. RHZ01]|uniref:acyltransferase family protein n=2 Tax=unclassified Rhizobium TaxID=2613769 RepID=UPI001786CB26|nr:acyltransferase [Rhizobium sp. RHZ01]NMN74485.1 peptidoglycan/LPS O-acetylase OafA/YrhL [Rhizobium sp. 57MFTsu3.2]